MPAQLHRLIERLEVEHLSHGGAENGNLFVPYPQFQACGVSKRQIRPLAELAEDLGLLKVTKSAGLSNGRVRPPNAYLLTYLPEKGKRAPTDDWRSISPESAANAVARFREREQTSRQKVLIESAEEMSA